MNTLQVTARNYAEDHENRMHSDDMAQRFGFRGALVPGVTVFGFMCQPLVERFGVDWLARSTTTVRFLKPAYDGDRLGISTQEDSSAESGAQAFSVSCHNESDTLLSVMESRLHTPEPFPNVPDLNAPPRQLDRVEICWENVVPDQPFEPFHWHATESAARPFADQVADANSLYDRYVHPHALLSLANRALTLQYVMPAWIHVSSELRCFEPLRVGDAIEIQAAPTSKWRRKGHEFMDLFLRYSVNGATTTEVKHTAIFQVAQ